MAIRFDWRLSYQNEQVYSVYGHPTVTEIERYSVCRFGLLEYQRSTYNHQGPEDFERIMVARQGGVRITRVNQYHNAERYYADRRWTPEFYQTFVQWLKDRHAAYLVEHEARRLRNGYTVEEFPPCEAPEIPRPIYYDPETKGFLTEPWFTPEVATVAA